MDRALLVDVTTYGFFHAGVEPLRREVLKRTWPLLPGATLFGALQAALIRLDGLDGPGPLSLVRALAEQRLRFTPLLPFTGEMIQDARSYCRQAGRLWAEASGHKPKAAPSLRYQTTPHAPIGRREGQIEGSLLYAVECHGTEQHYRGWIFCDAATESVLRRSFGLVPFLPFGGKGKFTAAEVTPIDDSAISRTTFEQEFAQAIAGACGRSILVALAMPAVVQGIGPGLLASARSLSPRPPRRYRVWRTGLYPDQTADSGWRAYGVTSDAAPELAWQGDGDYRVGQTSDAVVALPEGSSFVFNGEYAPDIASAFIAGLGRQDWASLGWGQIFVQFPGEGEE